MITAEPYGIRHIIKPGYGEPEPVEPVSTRDPQYAINRCLSCIAERCSGECKPNQNGPRTRPTQSEHVRLRDEKILGLIRAGWRNNDAICEELGISKDVLFSAKRRLREKGELL